MTRSKATKESGKGHQLIVSFDPRTPTSRLSQSYHDQALVIVVAAKIALIISYLAQGNYCRKFNSSLRCRVCAMSVSDGFGNPWND